MRTVCLDELEVILVFPGGVAMELTLAGKSIDISASVNERAALVRSDVAALPRITIDIVEPRGPEE